MPSVSPDKINPKVYVGIFRSTTEAQLAVTNRWTETENRKPESGTDAKDSSILSRRKYVNKPLQIESFWIYTLNTTEPHGLKGHLNNTYIIRIWCVTTESQVVKRWVTTDQRTNPEQTILWNNAYFYLFNFMELVWISECSVWPILLLN